ncbi:MAG: protein kinase [Myxococcales bacterium]|nr:protein kinase [Myxococcales bacterium]
MSGDDRPSSIPLGPFDLEKRIGRGGMADVWLGYHRVQGTRAAIKVMARKMAGERRFRAGFAQEVTAVAGLDHPGVVAVFDRGEVGRRAAAASRGELAPGSPWLAMEYAPDGTLGRLARPMRWRHLQQALLQILDALAHAHARGVIHRDLKPENVLLRFERDGMRLLLTDFGIAHIIEPSPDASTPGVSSAGTPQYMAPEQLRAEWRNYGPWTDLYALGCLAFELAMGLPPYDGATPIDIADLHLSAPIPRLSSPRPLPSAFPGWVARLMAKEAADRFETAADAAWHLARMPHPLGDERGQTGPLAPISISRSPTTGSLAFADTGVAPLTPLAGPTLSVVVDTALHARPTRDLGPPMFTTAEISVPELPPAHAVDGPPPYVLPPVPDDWHAPDAERPRLASVGLGLFGLRSTPFVDREAEREGLWLALREVGRSGRPRLIVLEGQEGCGKSRLAQWFSRRAEEMGAAYVLRVQHSAMPTPFDGIAPALLHWFRGTGLGERPLRQRIAWRLRAIVPTMGVADLTNVASPMASLLLRESGRSTGLRFESPTERYSATAQWLCFAAHRRPLIIWLDDAQWGAESLEFAEFLLKLSSRAPIAVVATVRTDLLGERPMEAEVLERLRALSGVMSLPIGPLPADDHARFVRELLGLSAPLTEALLARTQGNPLFAQQVVADWVDRDLLKPGEDGALVMARGEPEIPGELHTLEHERLRRLAAAFIDPPAVLQALEAAAALGHAVDEREWRRVCDLLGCPPPDALVAELSDRGLVRLSSDGWSFAHGSLVDSLVERSRREGRWARLHHACAQIVARGRRDAGALERRARHLAEAGQADAALAALEDAARARLETGSYRRVIDLTARHLGLADELGVPQHDLRRARALVLGVDAQRFSGRLDDARRGVAMLTEFPQPEVKVEVDRLSGGLCFLGSRHAEAERHYRAAAVAYATLGDGVGQTRSLHGLGWALVSLGRTDEAYKVFDRARAVARECGSTVDEAWALHGMSGSRLLAGHLDGGAHAQDALPLFEAVGSQAGVASARMFIGEHRVANGDGLGGRPHIEAAIEIWERIGSNMVGIGYLSLGLLAVQEGDTEAAVPRLEAVLGKYRADLPHQFVALAAIGLSLCAARRGEADAWRRGGALALAGPLADRAAYPRIRRELSELAERLEAMGALADARAAWRIADRSWRPLNPAEADACAARAARLEGSG